MSPPGRQSRPAANGPATVETLNSDTSIAPAVVYADEAREQKFRRHQRYQQRCPWQPGERRPRRKPRLDIETISRFTARVSGSRVFAVLERAGVPRQYDGDSSWLIPRRLVADVCAAAESMGGFVALDNEPTLFGGGEA